MPDFKVPEDTEAKQREVALTEIDKRSGGATHFAQDLRAQLEVLQANVAAPPQIVEKRCKVCMSPWRDHVDRLLASGAYSYLGIAKSLPTYQNLEGKEVRISRQSISSHEKKHLNVKDHALRQIMIKEAERQGQNWKEQVEGAITRKGMLEVAIRKGFEDIRTNVTAVEPKDLVNMITMLEKWEEGHTSLALDQALATVNAFTQAIMQNVDRVTWNRIAEDTEKILKGAGFEDIKLFQEDDPEVVDVELVPAGVLEQ